MMIIFGYILVLPPTITVTPETTMLYRLGESVELICSVSSDNVDSTVTACTEWRSRSGGISSKVLSAPNAMSSIINASLSISFDVLGMAVYDCKSFLTSTNEHIIDSEIVTVPKSVRVEGKTYC